MANKTFKIGMPYLVHLLGFLPFSVAQYREEILTIFGSYFGRNDDFIYSFWNLLTFTYIVCNRGM